MTAASSTSVALVGQLAETWTSIDAVCGQLTPAEWATPTACPGWTVADQLAHMVGTESMLAGHPAPPAGEAGESGEAGASVEAGGAPAAAADPPHVRNDIGRANEQWVVWLRRSEPVEVLEVFRSVTAERLEQLQSRSEAEWDEPSWTPVGRSTYRRFMQIRVFDCWVHEQDIRRALGRPGHGHGPAVDQSIDEIERALGYIIGKQAGAPDGTRISIELTGPLRRSIHVAVDGRASVVDTFDRPADVVLRFDASTFVALACGRVDPIAAPVTIEGDEALGRRITEHLAFTI